ncbi:MAG: hypothetical protein WCV73_00860 [Patescibacteria group bacterium]|jgi:hypothetical protein
MDKLEPIRKSPLNTITPSYRFFTIIFSLVAIVLVVAILYFALSQATIYITPNYKTQEVGFAVQVTENNPLADQKLLAGSAEKLFGSLKNTVVEESKTYPAQISTIATDKAGGEVTLINNYSKNQTLIATTRLLSPDNKLYRLTETVVVPAGGKITASAVADQPGKEFELPATKLTIPGLWDGLRDKIYAENTKGFLIQQLTKYEITQSAIDQAKDDLKNSLIAKGLEQIQKDLPEGQTLSPNSAITETIKYSTNAKIGSQQKEFTITLGLGVKALIFDEQKFKTIAAGTLPASYKEEGAYLTINPNSFKYEITPLDDNSEHLIAQIKGAYNIKIANIKINPDELVKMSKAEALKKLRNLSDVKEVSIMLPFWTKYLPALADKISIQIKQ